MTYTKLHYHVKREKPYLFIGSKIRGMLGYALKEEVCINPSLHCEGCFAAQECAFFKMYEAQNNTHSYRLDYKLQSEKFKFSLLLFSGLTGYEEAIDRAMQKALSSYAKFKVSSKEKKLKHKHAPSVIKLQFLTPLRIKKNNRFATREIDIFDILHSVHKRQLDLNGHSYQKLTLSIPKVVSRHLYYQDLTRRSNKQKTKMNLGGLMGEFVLSHVTQEAYDLLRVAEVIGAGKGTVFGLGKIRLEEIA